MFKCKTLFTKIRCVSWEKLFFSCCLVCIFMTRAFRCQYALENKVDIPASNAGVDIPCRRYTGFRRHWEVCTKPVYRRPTLQGSLRKAGIPATDVLRVKHKHILIKYLNVYLTPFGCRVFCYPRFGTEIIFYIPSPGPEVFPCLLFGTNFFLWYSC